MGFTKVGIQDNLPVLPVHVLQIIESLTYTGSYSNVDFYREGKTNFGQSQFSSSAHVEMHSYNGRDPLVVFAGTNDAQVALKVNANTSVEAAILNADTVTANDLTVNGNASFDNGDVTMNQGLLVQASNSSPLRAYTSTYGTQGGGGLLAVESTKVTLGDLAGQHNGTTLEVNDLAQTIAMSGSVGVQGYQFIVGADNYTKLLETSNTNGYVAIGDLNNDYNGTHITVTDQGKYIGLTTDNGTVNTTGQLNVNIGSREMNVFSDTYNSLLNISNVNGTAAIGDIGGNVNSTVITVDDIAQTVTVNAMHGTTFIGGITGSIQGNTSTATTASYAISASQAISASYAPDVTFPYTGSARITGSLTTIGDVYTYGDVGLGNFGGTPNALIVNSSNTDYINTGGANSSIRLTNDQRNGGQSIISAVNNTNNGYQTKGKIRIDFAGNVAYVAYDDYVRSGPTGSHNFYVGGDYSVGSLVTTIGDNAIDLKRRLVVSGSLLNGGSVAATGPYSHAEGDSTIASGDYSHAEGGLTTAAGNNSHAEGGLTLAQGIISHAEGYLTTGSGYASHAEGNGSIAIGDFSHAEGGASVASGSYSHAEGNASIASGSYSHAEGSHTIAIKDYSHAEGDSTRASGSYSHAEGGYSLTIGYVSHAEGYLTTASADSSHAEGTNTIAYGNGSHVEGTGTITTITGTYAHAEGEGTIAGAYASHAEGYYTIATGSQSHAEGGRTIAKEAYSHAEGLYTTASGVASHAEGQYSVAVADYSHAAGIGTVASGSGQNVVGQYNNQGNTTSLFVVGDGTSTSARHDVLRVNTGVVGVTGSLAVSGTIDLVGKINFAASTTAAAIMHLTVGSAPSSPSDGDIWLESNTNTGLKIRINGVTKTITLS